MNQESPQKIAVRDHDAAALIGVSTASLRSWRSQGRGPAYIRAGRRIVYRVSDLEAFLGANRVEPGSR